MPTQSQGLPFYNQRKSDEEGLEIDINDGFSEGEDDEDHEEDFNQIKQMIKTKQKSKEEHEIRNFLKTNNMNELAPLIDAAKIKSLSQLAQTSREHIRNYMGQKYQSQCEKLILALDRLNIDD